MTDQTHPMNGTFEALASCTTQDAVIALWVEVLATAFGGKSQISEIAVSTAALGQAQNSGAFARRFFELGQTPESDSERAAMMAQAACSYLDEWFGEG